jgi:uncharacterized membrane protein
MTGVLALLPVLITVIIMSWFGNKLVDLLGPRTFIGGVLRAIGLRFVTDPAVAIVIGWVLVLGSIWTLGVFIKSTARHRLDDMFHAVMHHIPLVGAIYKPISQVVQLLKRETQGDMQGMSVVFCSFGTYGSAGCIGFLATPERFRIHDQAYRLVYIPTSPIPTSGGLLFAPDHTITKVDMSADDVMKIYFSLGVLASQVVPPQYRADVPQG